jgi:hypothetical protein
MKTPKPKTPTSLMSWDGPIIQQKAYFRMMNISRIATLAPKPFLFLVLFALTLPFIVTSCGGSRGASGYSGWAKEYYKGDNMLLYYLKPYKFKGTSKASGSFLVDIAYLNEPMDTSMVVFNFTIAADQPVKSVKNLVVKLESDTVCQMVPNKFFVEMNKDWESRYHGTMPFQSLKNMFVDKDKDLRIVVTTDEGKVYKYQKGKKWKGYFKAAYQVVQNIDANN